MPLIYSIIETATHPKLSSLYADLGMEEQRFTSMRKLMAALKKRAPDYIAAEFIYGFSNNYAGVNTSNLDVLLYSLQKFAPDCRVIVFADKAEMAHTEKLRSIFPLHGVLPSPVTAGDIRPLLEGNPG